MSNLSDNLNCTCEYTYISKLIYTIVSLHKCSLKQAPRNGKNFDQVKKLATVWNIFNPIISSFSMMNGAQKVLGGRSKKWERNVIFANCQGLLKKGPDVAFSWFQFLPGIAQIMPELINCLGFKFLVHKSSLTCVPCVRAQLFYFPPLH